MSKGSGRRPPAVSSAELDAAWARTFGGGSVVLACMACGREESPEESAERAEFEAQFRGALRPDVMLCPDCAPHIGAAGTA